MKISFYSIIVFISVYSLSCSDDHGHSGDYEYHAHIISPNDSLYKLNDSVQIDVNFESHTGLTVHHVNIRIYNKSTGGEVYNQPSLAHVHATTGQYIFRDSIILTPAQGFLSGSNWILEARVWADVDG